MIRVSASLKMRGKEKLVRWAVRQELENPLKSSFRCGRLWIDPPKNVSTIKLPCRFFLRGGFFMIWFQTVFR